MLNGFNATINEKYHGLVENRLDYMFSLLTLIRILYGQLTFIFVNGIWMWVSAQYSVCVSCVALDYTVLLNSIHRGILKEHLCGQKQNFLLHFPSPFLNT